VNDKTSGDARCACAEQIQEERRSVIIGALALALTPAGPALTEAALDVRAIRPQPGDLLVFMTGENEGKTILPQDLRVGDKPRLAYPKDRATGTVRDGARFNMLVVARLDPSAISEETRPLTADGIVAYSAVCTHNGCRISDLNETKHELVCNCHGSTFDAGKSGEIVVGPTTRRLAILPLKMADGNVTVAAGFVGRLGPPQT
jgi:Rieske Fe-S protein